MMFSEDFELESRKMENLDLDMIDACEIHDLMEDEMLLASQELVLSIAFQEDSLSFQEEYLSE